MIMIRANTMRKILFHQNGAYNPPYEIESIECQDLLPEHAALAVMGYKLYRAKIKGQPDEITLVSKDVLHNGASVRWFPVEDDIWVVKAMTK